MAEGQVVGRVRRSSGSREQLVVGPGAGMEAVRRRARSPRPQRPQEIYDGAVADLVEAQRKSVTGEADRPRLTRLPSLTGDEDLDKLAEKTEKESLPRQSLTKLRGESLKDAAARAAANAPEPGQTRPPSGGRRSASTGPAPAPRVSSHTSATTSGRTASEPIPAGQEAALAPSAMDTAAAANARRVTSAPSSPKASATTASQKPTQTKNTRSPSAGPSRLRHEGSAPRPPQLSPPDRPRPNASSARKGRIVRRTPSSGDLNGFDSSASDASSCSQEASPVQVTSSKRAPSPQTPLRMVLTSPPGQRPGSGLSDKSVASPKAAPASRPAQLLVDAVRSKEDARLEVAIMNLRGGGTSGPVLGINDRHHVTGRTALHEAVALGRFSLVQQLLDAGADTEVGHPTQGPPLLHAAAFGEAEITETLLQSGANVHASDCADFTPLHYAAVGGHTGTALALLEAGASSEVANEEGQTPLDLAAKDSLRRILENRGLSDSATNAGEAPVVVSFGIPEEWKVPLAPVPPSMPAPPTEQRPGSGRSRRNSSRRFRESEAVMSNDITMSPGSEDLSPPPRLRLPSRGSESVAAVRGAAEEDGMQDAPPLPQSESPSHSPTSTSQAPSFKNLTLAPYRHSPPPSAGPEERRGAGTPKIGQQPTSFVESGTSQPRAPGSGGVGHPAQTRRVGSGNTAIGSRAVGSPAAQDMAHRTASGLGINGGGLQHQAAQMFYQSVEVQTGDVLWTRGELIGEGAYGKVFAGLNQLSGELMAVKVLPLDISNGVNGEEQRIHLANLEHELSLYKRFQHKHIVGYIAARMNYKENTMYIFLEYVPGGSIAQMLARFSAFTEELTRNFTRQLLLGLEYLHGCKVIHRDLKGANVLVTRDGRVKLADFGASKAYHEATITDGMKSIRGSVFWMAPEVIKGTGYGRRADIWSVGCTVIEMLTGKHPWPDMGDSHWSAMFQIAKTTTGPPIPPGISAVARDFLAKCFNVDAQLRPTASELLHHRFVSHIPNAFKAAEEAIDLNHSL